MVICDREIDQLVLAASASRRGRESLELAIPYYDLHTPPPLGPGKAAQILDQRQPEHEAPLAHVLANDLFAVPLQRCPLTNGAEGWEVHASCAPPTGALVFNEITAVSMRACLSAFAVGDVVVQRGRTSAQDSYVAKLDGDSDGPGFRTCSQALGYLTHFTSGGEMSAETRTTAVLKARRYFASLALEQMNACLAGDVWGFEYHAYQRTASGWRQVEYMEDAGFFGWRTLLAAVDDCFTLEAGRYS